MQPVHLPFRLAVAAGAIDLKEGTQEQEQPAAESFLGIKDNPDSVREDGISCGY